MDVYIYSHTHWDREWYLSQNQFQYRLLNTVDGIIDMITAPNSFHTFVLDGQTSVVEDYLALRPERRAQVSTLIADQRLIIGPWYTMPDMFLPDGESLIRNLLAGARDCAAYGTPVPNVGYVPDSFGHIAQIPQILRGFGIDNFMYSRGRPTALAMKDGHKLEFLWQAPDGSTVVTWFLPSSYVGGHFLPNPSQPAALTQRIRDLIGGHADSHNPAIALIPHGIDHIWLQPDIAEILDALPAMMPEVTFHHGSLEQAVTAWKQSLPDNLEVWQGPLRGHLQRDELHGTLSSRMDNKIANELAEMHIENYAEPLEVMATAWGKSKQSAFLWKAWRHILHNHAHDSICGCSQDRVHSDVNTRFREATEIGIDIADEALSYLANQAAFGAVTTQPQANRATTTHTTTPTPTLVIYAGLQGGARVIDVVVRLDHTPKYLHYATDAAGTIYPIQWLTCRKIRVQHTNGEQRYVECRGVISAADLMPCEVRQLAYAGPMAAHQIPASLQQPIAQDANHLSNAWCGVTINRNGTLTITDHETGHATQSTHYFTHETDIGGGYHFEGVPDGQRQDSKAKSAKVHLLHNGPLRAVCEISTHLAVPARYDRQHQKCVGRAKIVITTRVTVEHHSRLITLHTTIANTAQHQRLRLCLPTGYATETAYADSSFSIATTSVDQWSSTPGNNFHPMRNAVGLEEHGHGLAFMGRGIHEFEMVPTPTGTRLELTFLRSNDFVLLCSTWETPEAQLQKPITYDYAIMPYAGDWHQAGMSTTVAAFRNPAIANTYHDVPYAKAHEAHATVGYYEQTRAGDIPIDTNRSAWKCIHSQRDGWRRQEHISGSLFSGSSFSGSSYSGSSYSQPASEIPTRIVPFELQGKHLIVSALKPAEDGQGTILRFWSANPLEQAVTISAPGQTLTQVQLNEAAAPDAANEQDELLIIVKSQQIVTIRMQ